MKPHQLHGAFPSPRLLLVGSPIGSPIGSMVGQARPSSDHFPESTGCGRVSCAGSGLDEGFGRGRGAEGPVMTSKSKLLRDMTCSWLVDRKPFHCRRIS